MFGSVILHSQSRDFRSLAKYSRRSSPRDVFEGVDVMKARFVVLATTLATASIISSLQAQVTGATVVGKVTDATGSPVSNALIAVLRPSTGIEVDVNTNDTGGYTVPNLVPGTYKVTVSADNLATQQVAALTLRVGENVEEDFALSPATVVQEVVVKSAVA